MNTSTSVPESYLSPHNPICPTSDSTAVFERVHCGDGLLMSVNSDSRQHSFERVRLISVLHKVASININLLIIYIDSVEI